MTEFLYKKMQLFLMVYFLDRKSILYKMCMYKNNKYTGK